MNTFFGRKLQQTQGFLENGTRIPVTVVMAADNIVFGLKTNETDKYSAVKIGFGTTRKTSKPLLGQMKKANITIAPAFIREVKDDNASSMELGSAVKIDEVFKPGDIIDVTGTSKGKGFAGGVKRHGFKGGPKTHGQSDRHRAPGSIGSGTTPGRVYRGKRMAGNMGRDTVTVKNLLVINVDPITKRLFIQGLVPGIINSYIEITKVGEVKEKNFVPLFKVEEPVTEVANEATAVEAAPIIEDVSVVDEPKTEETAPETPAVEEEK